MYATTHFFFTTTLQCSLKVQFWCVCCVKQNKYYQDIWKIWSVQFDRGHAPLDVRNDSFLLHNNATMQFEGSILTCCCVKQNKYCLDIWKIWSVQFNRGHAPLDVRNDSFLLHNNTTMQFEGSISRCCCVKQNKYCQDIWKFDQFSLIVAMHL